MQQDSASMRKKCKPGRQLPAPVCTMLFAATTSGQIEVRVSVKVFVAESGTRYCLANHCDLFTDADLLRAFEGLASEIAVLKDRGVSLRVITIDELHPYDANDPDNPDRLPEPTPYCDDDGSPCDPDQANSCGVAQCIDLQHWHLADLTGATNVALRTASRTDLEDGPNRFRLQPNTVNVFAFPSEGGGRCACDQRSGPNPEAIIIIGQDRHESVALHEVGHFLGLCHTQGCGCGTCDDEDGPFPQTCRDVPGDDLQFDTVEDLECWDENRIAQENFEGRPYAQLTPNEQMQVDNVWYNLLSYHWASGGGVPPRLTSDQADRALTVLSAAQFLVGNTCVHFVNAAPDATDLLGIPNCGPTPDRDGNGYPDSDLDGSAARPHLTILDALDNTAAGDVLMIRAGSYPEALTINQTVSLRASRGNVIIGALGL